MDLCDNRILDAEVVEKMRSVVFKDSQSLEGPCIEAEGYDFDKGLNYPEIMKSFDPIGFQAANISEAIQIVNEMLHWRLSHEQDSTEEENPKSVRCKIFLAFTSNYICSGLRDVIRFLVQHHMVEGIVTTAAGIEQDIMKYIGGDTYIGDTSLPGVVLRSKGLNRIGNLLVPDDNFTRFKDWVNPILDQMLEEQNTQVYIS